MNERKLPVALSFLEQLKLDNTNRYAVPLH